MNEGLAQRHYLQGYRIQPTESLGQNFLFQQKALDALVEEMQLPPRAFCLEIGAGTGNLTAKLLERGQRVLAIEIDEHLRRALSQRFEQEADCQLVFGDALRLPIGDMLSSQDGQLPLVVLGNLPYYISSKLLWHFVIHCPTAQAWHFLLQKEFVDKIFAKVGQKTYGPLPIFLQLLCEVRAGLVLSPQAFFPPPHIQSQALHLYPLPQMVWQSRHRDCTDALWSRLGSVEGRQRFAQFLKLAFGQRRKQFAKLEAVLNQGRKSPLKLVDFLKAEGLPVTARAEELQPQQFLSLYARLEDLTSQEIKSEESEE